MNIQFFPKVSQYTLPKSPKKTEEVVPVEEKTVKDVQAEERKKVLQQLSEMQEAKKKRGLGNPKAEHILSKFDSGKKLSPEEIQYLMKNAPDSVERVIRISAEREQNELMMRSARTKSATLQVSVLAGKSIEKTSGDAGEAMIRTRHLQDSVYEYTSTEEYKEKPNTELDVQRKKKSTYRKPMHPQESVLWTVANHAYLKAKDLK